MKIRIPQEERAKSIFGQKYGRWTVLDEYEIRYQTTSKGNNQKHVYVKCKCECGTIRYVDIRGLIDGVSNSCGCLSKEIHSKLIKRQRTKHGEAQVGKKTRLYKIWVEIRRRCNNSKCERYKDYGGRGIKICDEWNDYSCFKDWVLSHGYTDELSIDRIDNDGNYEPDNCRWATDIEQANNKRNSRFITYNNQTHTLSEWSRIVGIKQSILWKRLNRGWDLDKALHTPVRAY